ncbi:MAG: transcriptional regulator [Hyphomicrobiales bacterium]|nr:MAG: transcriptional regulator [Hyphomicrobiales bacterium]
MELYQIRYFLAVCETLNFTRAAEQCNVSQPSLTRAIKKLEDELGGELFRRERSRTHMTELGRSMQPFLRQSLDSALAAKAQAENYGRGDMASLKLGLGSSIDLQIVLPALEELTRVMPGLKLTLVRMASRELIQKLEEGEIEISIGALDDVVWDRMNQWPLFTEEFMLIADQNHPLSQRQNISISDLEDEPLLIRSHCDFGAAFSSALEQQNIKIRVCHEYSDPSDAGALAGMGLGVTIVPRSLKTSEAAVAMHVDGLGLNRTVSLFSVSGRRYSSAGSALVQMLRAADWSSFECEANQ